MARIAQLVLAAALASGTLAAAPGAAAQNREWRGVDGNNVTLVRHSTGSFGETAPGRWSEFDARGRPFHSFEEQGRDAFTVTLLDRSRGVTVVLDLRAREIRGAGLFKRMRLLFTITDVEGGRRGRRGDRPDDRPDPNAGWGRDGLREVEVGPIWSQAHAERRCADAAVQYDADWTGQWRTTVSGRMSVCQLRRRPGTGGGRGDDSWNPRTGGDVDVGPIWNQADAVRKCTAKAREMGVEWNGNWTSRNGSSVCGMRGRAGPGGGGYGDGVLRSIEVGPIWNQADAETKCTAKARELRAEWTGHWRTTVQGRMSECDIRFR